MKIPQHLKSGDSVALVSTARAISPIELQPAIEVLASWGLKVKLGKNVYNKSMQFAGSDEERAADLQWALDDPEVQAIICTRGGYGTVRIIDSLDFSQFEEHQKWIAGYSDVTVLHNRLSNMGVASLHSTMPINFKSNSSEALQSLKSALFGQGLSYNEKVEVFRAGMAEGVLVGGNLSILYSLTGTKDQVKTSGKILFLEDLDEHLYHVDRMMMNLKRAGMLNDLAALVVGDVSDMRDHLMSDGFSVDNPFGKTARQIIEEHVAEFDYPVCFNFPAGHVDDNRSLIFGTNWRVEIGEGKVRMVVV